MDNEYLGMKSLTEIIHKQMQSNNIAEAEKHNPCKFYPSSVGKCLRAIVYQMQGYTGKPWDGKGLLIVENGTYFHNRIEAILNDSGLLIAPELSFRIPELRLSGRSDAVIHNFLPHTPSKNIINLYLEEEIQDEEGNPKLDQDGNKVYSKKLLYEGPDNNIIIVELKSINDSGFNYVDKSGAKEAHQMQLQLYMHITGIKQGLLLYENKNNQDMKEFYLGYDPDLAEKIIEKIKLANKHVDEKTLPVKEFYQTDFECRYCDYKDLCWPVKNRYTLDDVV